MSIATRPSTHSGSRRRARASGFTLVELMVAVTGGLFVSIMVFVLARDGARFYQREARVADATLGAMVGFERLRSDLGRAGYQSTPNIQRDPRVCATPVSAVELRRLASLRIEPDTPGPNQVLTDNGRSPDTIVLTGNYSSVDEFPLLGVVDNGGAGFAVDLQRGIGASARLGLSGQDDAADQAILAPIFQAKRTLRIVDQSGRFHFGEITSFAVASGVPTITVSAAANLPVRTQGGGPCTLTPTHTAGGVNVVNIVRYQVRDLQNEGDANYAPIFAQPDPRGWDVGRTELVREELDTAGNPIPNSLEIVAEYAVDLEFDVTVIGGRDALGNPTSLQSVPAANRFQVMGDIVTFANAVPQQARVIRARLSVRSREADREAPILPGGTVAAGFYRMGLGEAGGAPYARVRTLQADVTLHNHVGLTWW